MKEIIYLDTDLMNSMLAQLDEGLIKSFSLEQWDQEVLTAGQQSARGKSAGVNGSLSTGTGAVPGFNLNFGANLGNNGNEMKHDSRSILDSQKDILNKAFHDFALDLLIKKLTEKCMINDSDDLIEGDIHTGESSFRFYDFELIRKSMDYNAMKEIILSEVNVQEMTFEEAKKIVSKQKPNAKDRENMEVAKKVVSAHQAAKPMIEMFKQLNSLSLFATSLLEHLSILKAENKIGLLKKKYLRESPEALSFRTDQSRKVKFLVRVIGSKDIVYNGFNLPTLSESDLDAIPNMMLDIILGSFNIILRGDLLVTPIAIYYE
ncbi:hypothetical protein ABE096_14215 [Robertmurraya massiliosenegalensis]|uniref:DUF6414 family protein n=1 Tax=Robertmurraya TaxID=2837507 RepID=UPI0039A546BF